MFLYVFLKFPAGERERERENNGLPRSIGVFCEEGIILQRKRARNSMKRTILTGSILQVWFVYRVYNFRSIACCRIEKSLTNT